jgi:hypothetical protein
MRRRALVLVALTAALSLPLVSVPAYAGPVAPPIPVDAWVPGAVEGSTVVDSCAAAPELVAGCAATAFLIPYELTCQSLGALYGGQCDAGKAWHNIVHWVGSWFGAGGDQKPIVYTGPGAIVNPTHIPSGPITATNPATFSFFFTSAANTLSWSCETSTGASAGSFSLRIPFGSMNTAYTGVTVSPDAAVSDAAAATIVGAGNVGFYRDSACSNPADEHVTKVEAYYSTGHDVQASWTADPTPNAPWTLTYTETCQKPDGTELTASVDSHFTPQPNSAPPDVEMPNCNTILPGSHVEGIATTGGRGGANDLSIHQPVFNDTANADYPLCTTHAPVGGCYLDLRKNGVSCFHDGTFCAAWTEHESDYTCNFGPYSVAISMCETEFSTYFDTETQPDPNPSVAPGAGGFPGSGDNPGSDPAPGGVGDGDSCLGGIWSWNPVDWVMTPVKCALKWAFVPDSATLQDFTTTVKTSYDSTTIGQWGGAIGAVGLFSIPDGGCGGAAMHIPNLWGMNTAQDVNVFGTCDEPWHSVAAVVRAFITLACCWFTVMSVFRIVSASFGLELAK